MTVILFEYEKVSISIDFYGFLCFLHRFSSSWGDNKYQTPKTMVDHISKHLENNFVKNTLL